MGDLFQILLTLDEIIRYHPVLINHWNFFFKRIKSIQFDLRDSHFFSKLKPFFELVTQFDLEIMSTKIFEVIFINKNV